MKDVDYYIDEGRLKKVSADLGKAKGLMNRSLRRLDNAKDQEIGKDNAFQILENTYESLREAVEALMAARGYKSEDHVATIAWGAENLSLSDSKVNKLHKFRKLRNASRYEAEQIIPEQAKEIIDFADGFVQRLEKAVKEETS